MISYSRNFVTFDERQVVHTEADTTKLLAPQPPSVVGDINDPNLRHVFITQATADDAGVVSYCMSQRPTTDQTMNAVVLIDPNRPLTKSSVWSGQALLQDLGAMPDVVGKTTVVLLDQTHDDFREFFYCFNLDSDQAFSIRFSGACTMVRMPHDPNEVKTEHLRLGLRSESPGQQFHQEGLGTYRRITMDWERLGRDQLAALDQAYHTVPTLEAPVILLDDTDPQGAAYGRFIGFDWDSESFELLYHAQMVFEEIVLPS